MLLNMDIEIPRGPESINSRQILSSILGLPKPSKANGTILEALVLKVCNRRGTKLDEMIKRDDREANVAPLSESSEFHQTTEAVVSPVFTQVMDENDFCDVVPKEFIVDECHEEIISASVKFEEQVPMSADENLAVIETDIVVTNLLNENFATTSEDLTSLDDVTSIKRVHNNNNTDRVACEMANSADGIVKELADEKIEAPLSNIIITQKRSVSTFITKLPLPKFEKSNSTKEQTKPALILRNNEIAMPPKEIVYAIEEQSSAIMQEKAKVNVATGRPLTLPSAMELKSVLVGSPENQFIKEWKESELQIPEERLLNFEYGGISGVLAVFQGFLLKAQTFCNIQDKETAFTSAIADILWQSGQRSKACLAICGDEERLAGCGRYRRDGVTEAMVLLQFNSIEDTRAGIERHVEQLRAPGGLLLLVVSLVLSKGLEEFRGRPPLLNKANSTLVNLTLTGRLDMRDAKQRAEIGLLSLAEHYKHLKIPSCLKTPRWPIWVVEMGAENYAVISSTNPKLVADWRAELAFRLHIFDCEGLRSAAITTGGELSEEEERSATYLDMIIRTKWSGAQIRWLH